MICTKGTTLGTVTVEYPAQLNLDCCVNSRPLNIMPQSWLLIGWLRHSRAGRVNLNWVPSKLQPAHSSSSVWRHCSMCTQRWLWAISSPKLLSVDYSFQRTGLDRRRSSAQRLCRINYPVEVHRHFGIIGGSSTNTFWRVFRTTSTMEGDSSPESRLHPSDMMAGRFAEQPKDGPTSTDFLLPYQPVDWMSDLQNIPKYRIQLIHGVTPIQRWYLPNVPQDFEIHIKRDDMTGNELSGNKARKLEFLLADAIQQGCTAVITCGSTQSNHCRATAVAARQVGLQPHLLLRSPVSDPAEVTCSGNMLLNRLIGAHIHLMPRKAQFATDIKPRLDQLVQKIKEETGESAYPIPIGGSTVVGLFGYLQGFDELQRQGLQENFTDIVIACGSNGSTLGLALANYLTGSKLKVHGMIVSDDSKFHFKGMNETLREVDAKDSNGKALQAEDIVNLVDGVKGRGYGLSTQEELDLVAEVCGKTGIIIDPVYTGKSVYHLLRLTREKPDMFKGNKILFVHTGGIFGLFDGRIDETIKRIGLEQNKFHEWMELADQAPDLDL